MTDALKAPPAPTEKRMTEWLAPFTAPRDGTVIIVLFKSGFLYRVFWGKEEGSDYEAWFDAHECHLSCEPENQLDEFAGWIPSPRVPADFVWKPDERTPA